MSMTIPAVRPSSLPRVDPQGLGALYDTYGRQLFALAYRLLGISPVTSRVRLFRAMRSLRQLLEDDQ